MRDQSTRLCACGCGTVIPAFNKRGRALTHANHHRGLPGPNAPRLMTSGYARVYEPGHPLAHKDGYVFEHRYVLHEAGVVIPPGHDVHHLNGVKNDNRLENLAVVPESRHHGMHTGERRRRLTAEIAAAIRAASERGEKQVAIAARHEVSITTVSLIVRGKTWPHAAR